MSRILHADLDAFYASVEQRDDPSLANRPIIVGGGVVLAASYEARGFGVQTAMNIRQAKQLCPEVIEVPPRMEAYSDASEAVFQIFGETTPLVEGLSIDEAFLDVTGLARLVGTEQTIAEELRLRVLDEVGLPISVGGGSTKFLAKVASAVCKPNGLRIVAPGEELDFLHPLPVGRLWGVGPATEAKLASIGIVTVGDLAALAPERLSDLTGGAASQHLHRLANNLDPRSVEPNRRRQSIGSQRSFRANTVDRSDCDKILLDVVDRICRRLRSGGRVGRTVVLRLRDGNFQQWTRSRTLAQATDATADVLEAARFLLDTAWPEIEARGLTKLGVAINGLESNDAVQLSLPFDGADTVQLDSAIDLVRDRFGVDAVTRTALVGYESREVPLLPDPGDHRRPSTES